MEVAQRKLHFVVMPLMAQGHINRAIGLSRLLAEHGALVSIVTTPVNANRNRAAIVRLNARGLSVRFVELRFPCAEAGLPDGCESLDLCPSFAFVPFYEATRMIQNQLETYLAEEQPRPTCMIVDMTLPWTAGVARRARIPRLVFHGPPCFGLHCAHSIMRQNLYDRSAPDRTPIRAVVPGLPRPLDLLKSQVSIFISDRYLDDALEAERTADGIVVNTFEELEGFFIDKYREQMGKEVWAVGPVSQGEVSSGVELAVEKKEYITWLYTKEPRSVLYVNFGSLITVSADQLVEIGFGLEASGCGFVWVIKEKEVVPEVKEWLEGFEERTKARGLVIVGWAPQASILSHPSVGGFWTHCGWNSVLECITAGLPMITQPQFGDQTLNGKLITDVLRIGVEAKAQVLPTNRSMPTRDEVESAVRRLMDGGEDGEAMRKRAEEFGEKASKTLGEDGSSYKNMTNLIGYVAGLACNGGVKILRNS